MKRIVFHILTNIALPLIALQVMAAPCDSFDYQPSEEGAREQLLETVKSQLLSRTEQSDQQIASFIQLVQSCDDIECQVWLQGVLDMVGEQFRAAKIAQAISESRYNFFAYTRGPRTISDLVRRMQNGYIRPEQVANFDVADGNFTDQEKQITLALWYHIFLSYAYNREVRNIAEALAETKAHFGRVSQALVQTNVLLAFIRTNRNLGVEQLITALDRVRDFNNDFARSIESFRTEHSTGLLANIAIFTRDHEMGLVNFINVVDGVIENMDSDADRNLACSARRDLERQQSVRVRTSIGVGFGTAVVCGVGIWSGVGTLPALALCGPTLADATLGGARGVLNSMLYRNAFYAGRDFSGDIYDSHGILSYADQQAGIRRNQVVAAVNFIGMIPIGRALMAVRARGAQEAVATTSQASRRGTAVDLVKVPSVDVAVSMSESQAFGMAKIVMALRGIEWISQEDIDLLVAHALGRDN